MTAENSNGQRLGFGVDVGGSGIKGAVVDLETGLLVGERLRIDTPQPATPEAIAAVVARIVKEFEWTGSVGITLPSVIRNDIAWTAANIDPQWKGTNTSDLFHAFLGTRAISVINDADAAGRAEILYGAGKDVLGQVILLTFGTGIGSAVFQDGVLVTNTELGHFEVRGKDAEERASAAVRVRKELSWEKWAENVSKAIQAMEKFLWPDLLIAGGGISRKSDKWLPLLNIRTPIVPAQLRNHAGIVGAAYTANHSLGL